MEAINSVDDLDIVEELPVITKADIYQPVPPAESIVREVFNRFNFRKKSGLLQFWACVTSCNSEDIGCNLVLTYQTYMLYRDNEGRLQDYRWKCLENRYPFVGLETSVGNWLAGRAAQTRIADHKTMHHVVNQGDRHSADVGGMGQLVLPVFYDQGDGNNKLVGVIEYVTLVPKESYVDDFDQIHNLLEDAGLTSNYIGKMIKVQYNHMIKFPLPLTAEFTDLKAEVTKRFPELNHGSFRVEYDDTDGNRLPISSDEDLEDCLDESSSEGAKFIRMFVMLNT